MGLMGKSYEYVAWIHLAHDKIRWCHAVGAAVYESWPHVCVSPS